MTESSVLWLLAIMSGCLVVMTVVLVLVCVDVRRMLRRIDALLPGCDQTIREACRTLVEARRMLRHANQAAGYVEATVRQACHVASDTLGQMAVLKDQLGTWWTHRGSNGTGSGPRHRN